MTNYLVYRAPTIKWVEQVVNIGALRPTHKK